MKQPSFHRLIFSACLLLLLAMVPGLTLAQDIEDSPVESRVQGQSLIANEPLDPASYIRYSRFLIASGDWEVAEEVLEVGRNKANPSANLLIELSRVYETQRRFSRAESVLKEAVGIDPDNMMAWVRMGEIQFRMNSHQAGLKSYYLAVELSDLETLPRVRLIEGLLDTDQPDHAEELCLQYIAADPDNPDLWLSLGLVFEKQDKNREAFTTYGQVLTLDPDRAEAYARQGRLFCRFGQFESSEQACRQSLDLDEDNMLAHAYLGIACSRLGNGEEARKHAQIAETGGMNMSSVWEQLGK